MRKHKKKNRAAMCAKTALVAGLAAVMITGFAQVNNSAKAFEAAQKAKEEATANVIPVAVVVEIEPKAPALYDVPLSEELQLHIFAECEKRNVDPAIVLAMIERESYYTADAIGDNGNSYGLCQVQPRWWYAKMVELNCTDLLDPFQNVTVGIDILADLMEANGGDVAKALVCYNQGSYKGTVTDYAKAVLMKADALKAGEKL